MNTADLRLLRRWLGELLELPAAVRQARADALTATRPGLQDDLAALLSAAERDDPALEPIARADRDDEPVLAAGDRVGPFRLMAQIARGGMGTVWRAERSDGAFDQRVAIKFPRGDWRPAAAVTHFEQERRLLAALEHPGIARVVDGGTLPSGWPWLAMDFVAGLPIDEFAATRGLDARERIRLVLGVCDALAAAHRALVVHRDLKPGNVLVRPDGRPVLVDFGIAAALSTTDDGSVPAYATPRYASPEQLRGAVASTAGDVFAIGVLARELVAAAPGRPADPDLAAVLAAATAVDPAARTASVAGLAEDLERWVARRPVAARSAGPLHRVALFARRNPFGAAATSALLATICIAFALLAGAWRAERAGRHRAEAAELQLAQRLAQVREIVDSLVFGVHDRLGAVAGAVPVRTFVVETALRHLEQLASSGELATADPAFVAAVVEGHLRLASLRGLQGQGSLGDPSGARASAEAALDLAVPRVGANAPDRRFLLLAMRAWQSIGDASRELGDYDRALASYASMAQLARRGAESFHGDDDCALARATANQQAAKVWTRRGDPTRALALLDDAIEGYAAVRHRRPALRPAAFDLALAHSDRGFALVAAGDRMGALAAWQRSAAALDELSGGGNDDTQVERQRLEVAMQLALTQAELGDSKGAEPAIARALTAARALAATDVGNALVRQSLRRCLVFAARVHRYGGRPDQALACYAEALPLAAAALGLLPADVEVGKDLAECRIVGADLRRLSGVGDAESGLADYRAGLEALHEPEAAARGDVVAGHLATMAWLGIGELLLDAGRPAEAASHLAAVQARFDAWVASHGGLDWPLRQRATCAYDAGRAEEALAAASERAQRGVHLRAARARFAAGEADARRLEAEDRLLPHEREFPALFAADAARVDAALDALGGR